MNKRAISPVTIIFWSITFVIIYSMALAPIISAAGAVAVVNGGYTGIEQMFYENLNLVIIILFFIFVAAVGVVTSNP